MVLILIVMEYLKLFSKYKVLISLNPYCNGRYSWRLSQKTEEQVLTSKSLNPYCNGRYSWRYGYF